MLAEAKITGDNSVRSQTHCAAVSRCACSNAQHSCSSSSQHTGWRHRQWQNRREDTLGKPIHITAQASVAAHADVISGKAWGHFMARITGCCRQVWPTEPTMLLLFILLDVDVGVDNYYIAMNTLWTLIVDKALTTIAL
jgi:hypothetical protein